MVFVDSSALVAMLANEDDGGALAARLGDFAESTTSSIVIYETVLALCRIRRAPLFDMQAVVQEFLRRAGVRVVEIEADEHVGALGAHARLGKGTGHAAGLNLGDCFSYAIAKRLGVPLLYKGEDFVHTDLR